MAKDIIHDAVKNALLKDGWHITDDPFREDIVLGFQPPMMRPYTEFGVA